MGKIKKIDKSKTQEQTPEELHNFYEAYYSNGVKVHFDRFKVVNLLRQMGFYRYDVPDSKVSEMVRIVDNKIRIVIPKDIKDAFEDYIRTLPDIQRTFSRKVIQEDGSSEYETFKYTITPTFLVGKMYDNLLLFNSDLLERLRPLDMEIKIQEDDYSHKYIFFNNTAIEVSEKGIKKIPYKDLDLYIWENAIINRDYEDTGTIGDFERFIGDICNYDPSDENDEQRITGEQRKESLMSLLGYLMHNDYERPPKAVLFTDVNKDGAGEANGGTGKGILGKALAHMLNRSGNDCRFLNIPGKSFEFKDTRYSAGDLTTQLIHIEDLKKDFSFNNLYNDVTDGCLFRKLHHDPQTHKAKIMLSVNHTLEFKGSSDKRRLVLFELHNYYNEDFTPVMKYKHEFFGSRWTKEDWRQFDSFMVRCVEVYMKKGMIEPKMINYENRIIAENIPEDFIAFFDGELKVPCFNKKRYELIKKNVYDRFVAQYNDYAKFSRRKITDFCYKYLSLKHIPSAAVRKSGTSDDDVIVLYPDWPERYNKVTYIVKPNNIDTQTEIY